MVDWIEAEIKKTYPLEHLDADERLFATAFRLHEYSVSCAYEAAVTREPSLTANEWERRNPFIPPAAKTGTISKN